MRVIVRSRFIFIALLLSVSAPLAASDAPPEPSVHPDWSAVAQEGVQIIRNTLFDPDSLKIEWVSGFKWGYRKPVIGKRVFGWIACGNYNAKNKFGGYVGEAGFVLVTTPQGETRIYQYGDGVSTCGRGTAPINPELLAASGPASANGFSVADELAKLSDLHTKGVLTDTEFAEQKTKLLAR